MVGVVLILITLLVVLPVGVLVGAGVLSAIFGTFLTADGEARYEGSELVDLYR